MLKARMGGTCVEVENSEAACKIVPSPPKVAVRSTLFGRCEGLMGDAREGAYIGNGRRSWMVEATVGSRMNEIEG